MSERTPARPNVAFVPAMRLPASSCQPWCSDHANCAPPTRYPEAEDQLCRHVVTGPAFGSFLMTHAVGDGPMVNLYNTNLEMPAMAARQFAYAILAATDGVNA